MDVFASIRVLMILNNPLCGCHGHRGTVPKCSLLQTNKTTAIKTSLLYPTKKKKKLSLKFFLWPDAVLLEEWGTG